jgi:ribosomal protein S15P/S13E
VNQLQVDRSQAFMTPNTRTGTPSVKKSNFQVIENKQPDKSDAMVEYLRTEITHLREKNKNIQEHFEKYKSQNEDERTCTKPLVELMTEILRPGKDLIYQLCTDPHLSESFFYKEDPKFKGLDSKFCLDVVKIFNLSNERIVDLRTHLEEKELII